METRGLRHKSWGRRLNRAAPRPSTSQSQSVSFSQMESGSADARGSAALPQLHIHIVCGSLNTSITIQRFLGIALLHHSPGMVSGVCYTNRPALDSSTRASCTRTVGIFVSGLIMAKTRIDIMEPIKIRAALSTKLRQTPVKLAISLDS